MNTFEQRIGHTAKVINIGYLFDRVVKLGRIEKVPHQLGHLGNFLVQRFLLFDLLGTHNI